VDRVLIAGSFGFTFVAASLIHRTSPSEFGDRVSFVWQHLKIGSRSVSLEIRDAREEMKQIVAQVESLNWPTTLLRKSFIRSLQF